MKHLGPVSAIREVTGGNGAQTAPSLADAKTDFKNAMYRALQEWIYGKVNPAGL